MAKFSLYTLLPLPQRPLRLCGSILFPITQIPAQKINLPNLKYWYFIHPVDGFKILNFAIILYLSIVPEIEPKFLTLKKAKNLLPKIFS